ncbi:transglutaminase domain-containing protein [Gimesia aquarii]|uniref:transglutaminase domain-containing protein n=1 Tax=Gimesia aquarii TaxID=2527964 RepID=UPI0011A7BC87|nr:transglutaminase domain-containing protein [Gimesia aquarii]
MNQSSKALTLKPKRKLWRTRFKMARSTFSFATRIPYQEVCQPEVSEEELQHWGEYILLSDSVCVLHRDGTITRRAHNLTKLHANESLAQWDEVYRFYDRQTSLYKIQTAKVHLPDGSSKKAKKVVQPYGQTYLNFYPLRPGVTVEFEEQQDFFTPDRIAACMWGQEFLRFAIPCRRLRFTVAIAEPFSLEFKLHLTEQAPEKWKQGKYHVYQWDMRDVPGYETDDGTPHPRDVLPWVDFTTLSSWEPVTKFYMQDLDPPQKTPSQIQKLSEELTQEDQSEEEKLYSIYKYSSEDVRYGRHPNELNLEKTREVGSMLEDMRGDCKDKSSLMVSMLRHLGIKCNIAILLTRMNGSVSFLPGARFDHAIVCVDLENGKRLWLDPAGGPVTFKDLPTNDQGTQALLLNSNGGELTTIPDRGSQSHQINRVCHGVLSEDCSYQFTAEVTTTGDTAMELRLKYVNRNEESTALTLEKELAAHLTGARIESPRFINLKDISKKVSYTYRTTLEKWSRQIEDIILFRIPWIGSMHTVGLVNVQKRTSALQTPNPVRFTDDHKIEIPAGYQGYGLPYSHELECKWGRYQASVFVEGSCLICKREVDHRGGIVFENQYQEFKEYWEACTRADALDIVLMKKSA